MRAVIVAASAAVVLATAACTSGASHVTTSMKTAPSVSAAAEAAPMVRNPAPATTLYYSRSRTSSALYERALQGAGHKGRRVGRANGIVVTPGAAPAVVGTMEWFTSRTGRETLISPGQRPATLQQHPMPHGESDDGSYCALALNGRYYRQRGHDVVALVGDRIVARYRLPALRAEPWAVRSHMARRHQRAASGLVGALVPTARGHVLAFSFTGVAAGITDLMTGRTVRVPESGDVESAVRTSSGDLYAVVDRMTDRDIDISGYTSPQVVRLDPSTFHVLARMATGTPRHHFLAEASLLPGVGHDAVLSVLATGDAITDPPLDVWTVNGNRLSLVRKFRNGGADGLAPKDAHRLFVFAGNRVGVLDIDTGAYRPNVRRLDAPRGSVIDAIV